MSGVYPGRDTPAALSVGTATMAPDGTITLDLRANDNGMRGMARAIYPPNHPQYRMILNHLGGMLPGQQILIRPFPAQ